MPVMHELHLASLDLNLLVALDALLVERNVTRAAARIGITQSAMSHALARLRTVTNDPLLVRGKDGMVATVRAEALAPPIRRALEDIAAALRAPEPFDPNTARRTIRISTGDYAEVVLLPEVVARLRAEAPGIDLRLWGASEDVPTLLGSGAVDVLLAPVRPRDDASGIFARKLFAERFVCVVRRGHPLATKRLTLQRFVAADHVLIAPSGQDGSYTDDALARLGLSRRVAVTVPHFLVAPHVIARSDLVLTLAARVAVQLAPSLGLVVLHPPRELRLEGFTMSVLWHERTQRDPALVWFRDLLADVARTR